MIPIIILGAWGNFGIPISFTALLGVTVLMVGLAASFSSFGLMMAAADVLASSSFSF